MSADHGSTDRTEDSGQVSEVTGMGESPDPISPEDATAGYPTSESGEPDEGTAGPLAPPRHNPPEDSNESSR
jgi:hypothetical protein